MKGRVRGEPRNDGGIIIQFNLVGLILFTVSVVLAVGVLAYGLAHARARPAPADQPGVVVADPEVGTRPDIPPREIPPWGELLTSDIELEPPEEYLAFDVDKNWTLAWTFEG